MLIIGVAVVPVLHRPAKLKSTFSATGIYVDGYFGNSKDGAFITKRAVRSMRFNGGWGKGTLYHEYGHSIGYNEAGAYNLGLSKGRYWYYRHCKSAFPNGYK